MRTHRRSDRRSHAIHVDEGVARRELFDRGDVVREAVVSHVGEVEIVERLRTPRGPLVVQLNDDETELGQA